MKRAVPIILDTLHTLALSFWIGGILMIGACVAPAAFHIPGLTKLQSASVVGDSLRHFGPLVLVCGLIMVGAQFLLRRRYRSDRSKFIGDGVRQLATFAALLLAEYCRQGLFPAMDHARALHQTAQFDRYHHLYTSLAIAQVWILFAVVAIGAWLGLPQSSSRASAAATNKGEYSPTVAVDREAAAHGAK